jgi:hypothetical protein
LHKLIDSVWHSRASGQTDAQGRFRFRGFLGDYRVAGRVGEAPAITSRLSCSRRGGAALLILAFPAGANGGAEGMR